MGGYGWALGMDNFQCLLIWIIKGQRQRPTGLAVGVSGSCFNFVLAFYFSLLSPYLRGTARYRLKYRFESH